MRHAPDDLRAWLTGVLLPQWTARAFDPARPGFVEYLTATGEADMRPQKTTLVTARLTYVFSHGHCLDPHGPSLAAARHGLAFLLARCRGADSRFRHMVTADGAGIDERSDLYDLAFVLFALAWFHRATGERHVLAVADEVFAFIETTLAHPAGGFAEDTAGRLPRRQNPHMHLLEACHALAEATSDRRWLDRADKLVRLLRDRLFDDQSGSLGEFFLDDWTPSPGALGARREPGHQFEWVWLLHHHARLTGDESSRSIADRLYQFGLTHGGAAGSSAPIVDAVDPDGRIVEATRLLWPQTEYLKALAARVEFLDDPDAARRLAEHLELMFRLHVDSSTGLWVNQLDADDRPIAAELPVRVLYHILLALADVDRVLTARSLSTPR